MNTTVSVGVANYPGNGEDYAIILNSADNALYASKRSGRNKTSVSEGSD